MIFSNKNSIKNHDFFIFELLIIELCNFKCSYCYMRNESPTWGSFSTKKEIFKVIKKLEELNNKVSICLSGGEASLHPNFLEFVDYITNSEKIHSLHINTNLQLSEEKIEKILKIDSDVKFHISFHAGQSDKDFKIKLKKIPKKNQELNIMIHPAKKYKKDIDDIVKFCDTNNILYNIKPIFINSKFKPSQYVIESMNYKNSNKEYTDGNRDYNDYDLYKEGLLPMNTLGWECYYIFYTIDCKQGNIKQMCRLYDDLNIFKNFDFFNNYDLSKPIICSFKNSCLWASSLDHYKVKK